MIKFDAWIQPWIPVELEDGSFQQVSIFQALKDAHKIIAIRAATPTETFGISRLLITILTDIYRPKIWDDIDEVRAQGYIPSSKLKEYYNTCLAEGSSFDLFDTKRPFMQYAFFDNEKQSRKPAAILFDALPAGNNVPHFVHNEQSAYAFSPVRFLHTLCSIPFFERHKRGVGTTTGINGQPPIYFLYNGFTLFETLAISMIPLVKAFYKELGLPIWRETDCFGKKRIGSVELLHGLFAFPLKLQLKLSSDNLIREVLLGGQNIDYSKSQWQDPHIAYKDGEKNNKTVALQAKQLREVWRDMPIVIKDKALIFLWNWGDREINGNLTAFVRVSKHERTQSRPISQFVEELKINTEVLKDSLKKTCFSNAILLTDNIAIQCGDALKKALIKSDKEKKKPKEKTIRKFLPDIFRNHFLQDIKDIIYNDLVRLVIDANVDSHDWEANINVFLVKSFRSIVFNALTKSFECISNENTDILILKQQLKENAIKELNILLKEGGYSSDKNRSSK